MKMKIVSVKEVGRTWPECPSGPLFYVEGAFEDGSAWEVGVKEANEPKRKAEMQALIGVEGEFELEPKKDYKGQKQWKLKAWPGKPAFGGGASGGSKAPFQVAFNNSREGCIYTTASIQAQVALKAAVEFANVNTSLDELIKNASAMHEWLASKTPDPAEPP